MAAEGDEIFNHSFTEKKTICLVLPHAVGDCLPKPSVF
jgi:hypothetical protein